ncbi:putative Sel1 repeat protein [uncultured Alphaproteobacteria bacterium]|uniref:Putative Sel1 repeat protein n=1 Tax=uncultured Alphaproteobacteria bacterium TaxID=91750 RepID=A0A212KMD7_9PROT|nr:putative Sel1 repeat protein [uncultured Alphaproteobacteria bacterium]
MRLPLAALCLALSFAPAAAQTVEDGFEAYDAGDYATAKTILLPLAEAGDAQAMNLVGYMYDLGKGFPKDVSIACDWYEKSALEDYAGGQSNLSLCFREGSGRSKDLEAALRWEIKAAENGHLESQISLIRHYKDRDLEKTRYWVRKALLSGTTISRVAAWYAHVEHEGPSASLLDKACIVVVNGILRRPWRACDDVLR